MGEREGVREKRGLSDPLELEHDDQFCSRLFPSAGLVRQHTPFVCVTECMHVQLEGFALIMGTSEEVGVALQYERDKNAGTWFCTHQSKVGCYSLVCIMFGYTLISVVWDKMFILLFLLA